MSRTVRDITITLILIGSGLLILFSFPPDPEAGPVVRTVHAIIRPFQQAVFHVHSRVKEVRQSYVDLLGVREENKGLKQELNRLLQERSVLLDKEHENRRLTKLLDLKTRYEFPSLVAQVIGEDAVGWYRTFFINRGLDDGVGPGMPVTTAGGVVGRVVQSSAEYSRVMLLTDPNFSLDCRVLRTRDRGVLSGSLDRKCILRYIGLKSEIKQGDEVVTSGLDGVFPRGLPVGSIEKVNKGDQGLFLEAEVTPATDFPEVEEVLVILAQRGGFDIRPGLEDKR